MNWLAGETLGQTVDCGVHSTRQTAHSDRLLMCPDCSLSAHYTCDNVWVPRKTERNTGHNWDVPVTGGCVSVWEQWGPAKSRCVTTQTYCIAQCEAHSCIYILQSLHHHPLLGTTQYKYLLPGGFVRTFHSPLSRQPVIVSLSRSHYQILGSNVIPATHIWARLECWGLSLLIVFAGGIWLEYVWRVAVVVVVWCQHKPVMRIWKLL